MVFDGSWWLMVVLVGIGIGSSLWFLVVLGCSLWFFVALGGSWWLLVVFGGSWGSWWSVMQKSSYFPTI